MKALILARSGFGKSTSIGEVPELNLKGLNPKETFIISCVNKPLPFKGASSKYRITTLDKITAGNRIISKDATVIAQIINILGNSPYKNIILDDANYPAQDYYMKNALKGGWDTPKMIGYNTGLIFEAMDNLPETKNFFMMAHYDAYRDKGTDAMVLKYKSTGNMVNHLPLSI